jgi:hypothetical protein
MATKADFTTEEWITFKAAPQSAALYVLTASPSGPVGIVKEMFAVAKAAQEIKKDEGALPILKELFAEAEGEPQAETKVELSDKAKEPAQRAALLTALTASVTLIDAKLGGDASAVKQWIYDVGEKVARAAKEGSFLGMGGTLVSAEEQTALDELKGVLGIYS